MRHNVQGGIGNCTVQDNTELLSVTLDSIKVNDTQHDTLDMTVARMYDLDIRAPMQADYDYADIPNCVPLSEFKQAAIAYIAGYVVRMVKKKITRTDCQYASTDVSDRCAPNSVSERFMSIKDRGGLVKPSKSVIIV